MRRLCALGLALLVACTSDASDLLGGGADAGARADSGQAQPDAGASLSCAEASAQISQDDRPELLALGFRLATTVLEGELGVGAVDGNFLRASFRVTRVRRGHAGLLGATVEVLTDHAMASADPEEVVLGFDDGGFGQYTDDMRHILGATLVAAREEEWAGVEPFLDYNGFEVGAAYVVEVRAVTDEALSLFVHDTLAGPQARVVELQWSSFGRPRPSTEVSEDRYILSLPELEVDREGFGSTYFPFVLDWRAATAEARAEVERVLAAPPPPVDADALRAFAEAYALGFVFFLAPHPVTTEVTGIAFECCTGAGGTYVRHEVRRGADEGEVFQRGGHAYYSDEACGDRRLLAAGELVPPTSTQPFDCDQGGAAGDYEPVTAVLAELDDTPTNAARVRAWVEADRPLYRVGPQDRAPATPSPSGGFAPWSSPLSVPQGLTLGAPVLVRVVDAERQGEDVRVELETTFTDYDFEHQERFRVALTYRCGDERLLEVGRSWVLPFVDAGWAPDRAGAIQRETTMFAPGVLFDPAGPWRRIHNRLHSYLRNTR